MLPLCLQMSWPQPVPILTNKALTVQLTCHMMHNFSVDNVITSWVNHLALSEHLADVIVASFPKEVSMIQYIVAVFVEVDALLRTSANFVYRLL